MKTTLTEEALITDVFSPTAVVTGGRWIDAAGNQLAVAGAQAHALAVDDFTAANVANATGIPASKLAGIRFGFGETEIGADVANNSFVMSDASGRSVVATAGKSILGFVPKGATGAGKRVRVLVLCTNFDNRAPSTGIADLAGGATTAQIVTAFNTLLAALEEQKVLAVA